MRGTSRTGGNAPDGHGHAKRIDMGNAAVTTCYTRMDSPIGSLLLVATPRGLAAIELPGSDGARLPDPAWSSSRTPFRDAIDQLNAYFPGALRRFDLPLAPEGTPFQQRVWQALLGVPYGQTVSYAEIARRIGRPAAGRAVGAANGRNPIPIVIPCHRVVGSDGRLVGYGGGLDVKRALLTLERGAQPARQELLFPPSPPEPDGGSR